MKKWTCLCLVWMLMVVFSVSGAGESLFVDNRETDKIHPERLNMRAEPAKDGDLLGLYYSGAEVTVLEPDTDGYTKVEIGGIAGYMASEYLITAEEAIARYGEEGGFGEFRAAQIDLTGMWKVRTPLLEGADAKARQIAYLENGTYVKLAAVLNEWAYIQAEVNAEKQMGYVPLDVLTDVNERKVVLISGAKADTKVYLYATPSNSAKPIMTLKNGTACFNLFGRTVGGWHRVRVGGVSGWIKYTQNASLYDLGDEPRSVVPYYPLLMQTENDALLYREKGKTSGIYMTLGREMEVEVLAECDDYVYVRTLEGGAGAYDCGDFGYMKLSDLKLARSNAGVGVAQVDDGDLPALLLEQPDAEAKRIGVLCSGAQVRITEYTQTDYVKVALGDMSGYIPKDEIRLLTYAGAEVSQKIPQRAKVLKDAHMHQSPSRSSKKLEKVPEGSRVYMLGHFGKWAFVQYADKPGLDVAGVSADRTGFMELSALSAPASTTHLTATLTGDQVNLRSRASSTTGQIIGTVRLNELVRVADYGVNWCLVQTIDGRRGYLMTKYLQFE